MGKPIVAVDFDGVIHSYKSGWKGVSNIPDPPVPGAIDGLFRLLSGGFEVHIFSSRSKSYFGRRAMQRWLGKAIVKYWTMGGKLPLGYEAECEADAFNVYSMFKWPWFKPSAVMTIDDRAVQFNGDWSDYDYSPMAIKNFKPWNKQ